MPEQHPAVHAGGRTHPVPTPPPGYTAGLLAAIRQQTDQRAWIGPRLKELYEWDQKAEEDEGTFRFAISGGVDYSGDGSTWTFAGWGQAMARAGEALRSSDMGDWGGVLGDGGDETGRLAIAVLRLAIHGDESELADALETICTRDVLNRPYFRRVLSDLGRDTLEEYRNRRKLARRELFSDLLPVVPHLFDDVLRQLTSESALPCIPPAVEPVREPPRLTRKGGRPPETDYAEDQRAYDVWQSGAHRTYADLAKALAMGKAGAAQKAVRRHAKRLKAQARNATPDA